MMRAAFGVVDHGSLLAARLIPHAHGHRELRALQNTNWARESLRRGIVFAKKGARENVERANSGRENLETAMRCYQVGIVHPQSFCLLSLGGFALGNMASRIFPVLRS